MTFTRFMWKMKNCWSHHFYGKVRPILILMLLWVAEGQRPPRPGPGGPKNVGPPTGSKEDPGGSKEYTTPISKTKKSYRHTTPVQMSFVEECDYLAYYCLRAYKTGKLCGRTVYYRYQDFDNYCMLDYINCMERYEVWQVAHMGECFNVTILTDYMHYEYLDDHFLDVYYVIQD